MQKPLPAILEPLDGAKFRKALDTSITAAADAWEMDEEEALETVLGKLARNRVSRCNLASAIRYLRAVDSEDPEE